MSRSSAYRRASAARAAAGVDAAPAAIPASTDERTPCPCLAPASRRSEVHSPTVATTCTRECDRGEREGGHEQSPPRAARRGRRQREVALQEIDRLREAGGGRRGPPPRGAADARGGRSRAAIARGRHRPHRARCGFRLAECRRAAPVRAPARAPPAGRPSSGRRTGNALPSWRRTKASTPRRRRAPAPSAIRHGEVGLGDHARKPRRGRPAMHAVAQRGDEPSCCDDHAHAAVGPLPRHGEVLRVAGPASWSSTAKRAAAATRPGASGGSDDDRDADLRRREHGLDAIGGRPGARGRGRYACSTRVVEESPRNGVAGAPGGVGEVHAQRRHSRGSRAPCGTVYSRLPERPAAAATRGVRTAAYASAPSGARGRSQRRRLGVTASPRLATRRPATRRRAIRRRGGGAGRGRAPRSSPCRASIVT